MDMDPKQQPSEQWVTMLRDKYPTEDYVDRALSRKLTVRPGPPHQRQSVATIGPVLKSFLDKRLPGSVKISELKPLTGGSSKEQFSFTAAWTDESGSLRSERLVLRLQPAESIVETHRQREFDVMRALKGFVPVPDVYWVDPEGDEFEHPALICGFCEGVARPPVEGLITGPTGGFGPHYRKLLAPQFVSYLADIHNFDCVAARIPSLDVPQVGTTEGVIWVINWWQRVWEEDAIEPNPFITIVAQWLRENVHPIDQLSLIHTDYKGGNFLFTLDSGIITSILDWELVHLGDRHEDLALILDPLYGEVDENGELLVCGLYRREEFLREYERVSGLSVDSERLRYFEILTSWRSAIISQGTAPRCARAQKTNQDILLSWVASCAFTTLSTVQTLMAEEINGKQNLVERV